MGSQGSRRVIQSKDLKRFAEVDGIHNALVVESEYHNRVHRGTMHHAVVRDVINAGQPFDMLFLTGSCVVHARFGGNAQRLTNFTLFEGATSASPPAVIPKNKNRTSSVVAKSRFSDETAALTNGTLLSADSQNFSMGGTTPGEFFGGEWILQANTLYLFKGFNSAGATSNITMLITFYEEPA